MKEKWSSKIFCVFSFCDLWISDWCRFVFEYNMLCACWHLSSSIGEVVDVVRMKGKGSQFHFRLSALSSDGTKVETMKFREFSSSRKNKLFSYCFDEHRLNKFTSTMRIFVFRIFYKTHKHDRRQRWVLVMSRLREIGCWAARMAGKSTM